MLSKNEVKISRHGHIYFGYRAAQFLGITGWKWLKITPCKEYTLMRICMMETTSDAGSYVTKLNKVNGSSVPMASSCAKFADELASRFGEFESLSLRYTIYPGNVHGDGESVLISVDNPPNKFVPANSDIRTIPEQEEEVEAREAYFAEFEKSLGTISKPTEPPALGKPATAPRTRPLPKGLPEWLSGPFSRGEHVLVSTMVPGQKASQGWGIGANSRFGKISIAVAEENGYLTKIRLYHPKYIFQSRGSLKPAAECYKIAGKLEIGLSALQIEAINKGGVPSKFHDLPDEMFE